MFFVGVCILGNRIKGRIKKGEGFFVFGFFFTFSKGMWGSLGFSMYVSLVGDGMGGALFHLWPRANQRGKERKGVGDRVHQCGGYSGGEEEFRKFSSFLLDF